MLRHQRFHDTVEAHSLEKGAASMAASLNGVFKSCIGKGTKISGKLNFKEPASIEGEAEGEITGGEIVIAPGAVVSARIAAVRLTIGGTVTGEVVARERVELLPTARLRCTLVTPSLVLNEGAQFDGDCKMPRERAAA
jgi:cytoskeletal protein CcmA (bactofilin family)